MKPARKFMALFTIMAFVITMMAVAFADSTIDWSKGVMQATGLAAGKKGEKRIGILRAQARRAARMDAERNLAEQLHGVQVTGDSTMQDLELQYDSVRTQVAAVIQGMYEVGDPKFFDDGTCEITMEVPLYGNGLSAASAAFIPYKDQVKEPFPQPTNKASVTTTTTVTTTTNQVVAGANVSKHTGLIVDCSGLNLNPVMSPVIKNNDGQSIYGHKNLDYDKVIRDGMASYTRNVNDQSRAGSNPIIVKAVSLDNHNANPVVSVTDADAILIANQNDRFLDDCAVVFVR